MHTRERDLEDVFTKYGSLDKVTVVYDHRVSLVEKRRKKKNLSLI